MPAALQAQQQVAGSRGSDTSSSKAAVEAAINSILQEQQQPQQTQPQQQQQQAPSAPLRLSLYLPAACVVVGVPGSDPSLPKYFAADVRGSSSQLLASMAPRLGSQAAKVRHCPGSCCLPVLMPAEQQTLAGLRSIVDVRAPLLACLLPSTVSV